MKIRNISRFGDLDIPALGRSVAAGEVITVNKAVAAELLAQADNFEPAEKAAAQNPEENR